MLRSDLATAGTELEVEIYGERVKAVVQEDKPLWDFDNRCRSMKKITLLDGSIGQELVKRSGDRATALWSTMVMIDKRGCG